MTNQVEHRRGKRMAAAMWVRLSSTGAELAMAKLVDVSISGAFLETSLQLPANADITLESVSTAGAALEGLKIAARVARVDRRGLGIEWRVLATPETLTLLGVEFPPPVSRWVS
jgi:hypothetical protein